VLRTIVREARQHLSMYASVIPPGSVAEGDGVIYNTLIVLPSYRLKALHPGPLDSPFVLSRSKELP
jgi:hypothetical protein